MTTVTDILDDQTADQTELIYTIVERTKKLYSLPAVAAEVIQLTNHPQVDSQALKECIEKDPALTVKLLRVVNSSLFGLSSEVSDLNQALALLGTKPLKLLVLGFSLPEELFAGVAQEQLAWYWRTSLVRAVAAREISQRYWNKPGDDAFLAGLLQDIGVLALLDQLREPYARFLSGVIEGNRDLSALEVLSLGFDHRTLSVALLRGWKLPSPLVDAIATDCSLDPPRGNNPADELPKILHMASLLAELVGQNRLQVLPELLAVGEAYCGFDKQRLHEIVAELQPKVEQLADVLSLDLDNQMSYGEIIAEAHQQMSQLCEELPGQLTDVAEDSAEPQDNAQVRSTELRSALSEYVKQPMPQIAEPPSEASTESSQQSVRAQSPSRVAPFQVSDSSEYRKLTLAVGSCRSRRQPLSFLLLSFDSQGDVYSAEQNYLRRVINRACRNMDCVGKQVESIGPSRWQIILPGCERHQAVSLVNEVFSSIRYELEQADGEIAATLCSLSAGISSVTLPPRNFQPPALVHAAQRCLYAAELSDATVVKSIEIF